MVKSLSRSSMHRSQRPQAVPRAYDPLQTGWLYFRSSPIPSSLYDGPMGPQRLPFFFAGSGLLFSPIANS